MARKVLSSPEQSLYGQPQVQFRPNDFDSAIWSHGYDIIAEQAIRCPCQGSSGAPMIDCQNCHGFGYFFVNPQRTKALITGLNRNTQYVQWTPELMGTASITVRDIDKSLLTYFNRVTVEDEYATFTEMLTVRVLEDGTKIVFLSYAPIQDGIEDVYIYDTGSTPLIRLEPNAYAISETNPYALVLDVPTLQNGEGVSIVYRHLVEYHIIDLPHEIRSSLGREKNTGLFQILRMPIQAIGRRTHLIDIQRPQFDGSGIIYNDV